MPPGSVRPRRNAISAAAVAARAALGHFPRAVTEAPLVVWGPELSPFLLKLESMLVRARAPFRRLPRDGSRLENLRMARRISLAQRHRTALRPHAADDLDEYPLVPYLVTAQGDVLYDSSALAQWLDARSGATDVPLVPADPAIAFVVHLVDEAFDELGLYLVHHNRWKLAAGDNDHPGTRLAREYARLLPPGSLGIFARWFDRRQVRRLPYLFSVAPEGYTVPGLASSLTPPSRKGFPPTHELLESMWELHVGAVDAALAGAPFLFGEGFTLADASVYGQLSMNLTDPAAARRLREISPRTFDWLCGIRDRKHATSPGSAVSLRPELAPLVEAILDTFVPLMRANEKAWSLASGSPRNEAAFDAGIDLYDGELLGLPFRSVAKSFQARTWRDLRARWNELGMADAARVRALAPHHDWPALFSS